MKVKILEVKDGSFTGSEGDKVSYFYHKAIRVADDINFEFGSTVEHAQGEYDLNLVKYEKKSGKVAWKEVVKS